MGKEQSGIMKYASRYLTVGIVDGIGNACRTIKCHGVPLLTHRICVIGSGQVSAKIGRWLIKEPRTV